MDQAALMTKEKVQVVNVTNGERFDTYLIEGARVRECYASTELLPAGPGVAFERS